MGELEFFNEVKKRFPRDLGLEHLPAADLLPAWWIYAQLTDENVAATQSTLTKAPDGGVDAVYIDDESKIVHLIQGKFHEADKLDQEAEFSKLTRWGTNFTLDDEGFAKTLRDLSAKTRNHLKRARKAVVGDGYELRHVFVSTGHASKAGEAHQPSSFVYIGRRRLLALYDDYLAGVRPVDYLELPVEPDFAMTSSDEGVVLGVYVIGGAEIHKIVEEYSTRLFARNVRGFQGEKVRVNQQILKTIRDEPDRFKLVNNGLTIVCDSSQVVKKQARNTLQLTNPQIVNGQQTSRCLESATEEQASKVQVIVKVVEIDRVKFDADDCERLVREVVEGTNLQSSIDLADLRANDVRQVDLQRALRRLGHYYARKKAHAGEHQIKAGGLPIIQRKDLADAVGGCLEESLPHRVPKKHLYEGTNFERIFDPTKASRNLACFYVWKSVQARCSGGTASRVVSEGKWLALYEIWQDLDGDLSGSRAFVDAGRAATPGSKIRLATGGVVDCMAAAVETFYVSSTSGGAAAADPVKFFKTMGLHPKFRAFLGEAEGNPFREQISRSEDLLRAVLASGTSTADAELYPDSDGGADADPDSDAGLMA